MKNRTAPIIAALLFTAPLALPTDAFAARWATSGQGVKVSVSDCRNCGDNTGIIFKCTGNGQPARITVNAAASNKGRDGAYAPVTFTIDGRKYTYQAKTIEYGQIGFTPEFDIAYDDPLTEALSAGRSASVRFNGGRSKIRLKGSRAALDTFKKECGWTKASFKRNLERHAASNPKALLPIFTYGQSKKPKELLPVFSKAEQKTPAAAAAPAPAPAPADNKTEPTSQFTQTVLTRSEVYPDENGAFWFTGNATGGGSPKSLTYGKPETDLRVLNATCEDFSLNGVSIEAFIATGKSGKDEPVTLEITHAKGTEKFSGITFAENEEYAGSRYLIPKGSAIWEAMSTSPIVSLGIGTEEKVKISGIAGRAALSEFAKLCGQN